jgi:acetylornithine deacetylase/succinyl-diaminopimelate desuccinylase family protein
MINSARLIKLTKDIIRIKSENPPGDEYAMGYFVKDYLEQLGVRARIYEFERRRSNVVAVLRGRGKSRSLLLTPHLDTVPAGGRWRTDPFRAAISKGRLYGRGATDDKGNLACILEAINSLIEEKVQLGYDLVFAATADEETGSRLGLIPLLEKGILSPNAAVVLDSDDFGIIITQKGLIHLKIKIQGKKAHGAYPWRGINAIEHSVDIIKELKKHKFAGYKKNKYLRPPTLNIGTIKGGDKVNIVADWCEFELDFRFLPDMQEKDILKDIKDVTRKHSRNFKIEIESIQKPYRISKDHSLVHYLMQAIGGLGVKPIIKGSEGATVLTFFQDKNIPAVATGFGSQGCAHTSDEYVRIDNLYKGAKVLEEFTKIFKFG